MDKEAFIKQLHRITTYKKIRRFILENNMPKVAAIELGLPKEEFTFLIRAVENIDCSVDYLMDHYAEIVEKHKDEIEAYKQERAEENKRRKEEEERKITSRSEAILKNRKLVESYERFKKEMCYGLGQRETKFFLNDRIKKGDRLAKLYRVALELENVNINAKKYRNTAEVA